MSDETKVPTRDESVLYAGEAPKEPITTKCRRQTPFKAHTAQRTAHSRISNITKSYNYLAAPVRGGGTALAVEGSPHVMNKN